MRFTVLLRAQIVAAYRPRSQGPGRQVGSFCFHLGRMPVPSPYLIRTHHLPVARVRVGNSLTADATGESRLMQ